jgi:molybdopterin-synthase adenylyltransferase
MRYNRQELVVGKVSGKVAIVGVGALGTVCSDLLVRAGFNVLLIDRDIVELSNLQRQSLFLEEDVGKSKAISAVNRLKLANSSVNVEGTAIHLNSENISCLDSYDIIVDCTDNVKTRLLLNRYCKGNGKSWVYGAAIKDHGYVMTNPCIECFLTVSGETCDTVGVLGGITHIIGSLQAQHVIDLVRGKEREGLFYVTFESIKKLHVKKNPSCAVCKGDFSLPVDDVKTIKFCGRNLYQVQGKVRKNVEYREGITLFPDGRALVKAGSEEEALSVYSKFVGD